MPSLEPAEVSLLEAFRARYPFVLDPFQEEAIHHIAAGSSVIVSAPTGAGKTLIAEYAIFSALAQDSASPTRLPSRPSATKNMPIFAGTSAPKTSVS